MDATKDDNPKYNEKNLSYAATALDCYTMVKNYKDDDDPDKVINGMTWVKGGSKQCFAKFGVIRIMPLCNETCETCIFGGTYQT